VLGHRADLHELGCQRAELNQYLSQALRPRACCQAFWR
jgi:hypothetical protein